MIAQNIPKDMPIQTLHTKASRTVKEDELVTLGDVKTMCARSYQFKKIKTYGDTGSLRISIFANYKTLSLGRLSLDTCLQN